MQDADVVAQQCAEAMWSQDRASRELGMELVDVGPGRSQITMSVTESMVNGHDICHGGYLATLADSAFAFACNSYNVATVAAGFDIAFLAPARLGDRLTATALERVRSGRNGIYDVTIWRGEPDTGERIAELRGRSRSLGRPVVDG